MSIATSFIALGIGALTGGAYALREYYLPIKNEYVRDREQIRELEEEIVRLKREMQICGIRTTSEGSKIMPRK
jgi:hypothetical protein